MKNPLSSNSHSHNTPFYFRMTLYGSFIIFFITSIFLWIIFPESRLINTVSSSLSLFLFLIILWMQKSLLKSPVFQYFFSSSVRVCLVFLILMISNYLSYKHPFQRDLSFHEEFADLFADNLDLSFDLTTTTTHSSIETSLASCSVFVECLVEEVRNGF